MNRVRQPWYLPLQAMPPKVAPLLLALLLPLSARAEDPPCTGDPAEHLHRGDALRKAGADNDALRAYRCAHSMAPSAKTLAQIGLAEAALGRWVDAEKDLAAALAQDGDAFIQKYRADLAAELAAIRAHLGDLEILGPQGALLRVAGLVRGRLPLAGPLRLPAGSASIEVMPPGAADRPLARQVTIRAGGLTRETFEAALPNPTPRAEGGGPSRAGLLGWVALGGAGLFLAGGVVAQAAREALVAQYNGDSCLDDLGNTRAQSCGYKLDDARVAQGFAVAGFVTAAGLSAAALGLLLPRPSDRRERRLGLSISPNALFLRGAFD